MATLTCPECMTRSPLPDQYLGRKVVCKNCKTRFVALATDGPAPTVGGKETVIEPNPIAGQVTALAEKAAPSPPIVVTAYPLGGKKSGNLVWLSLAILFLIVPALALLVSPCGNGIVIRLPPWLL